MGCWHQIQWIVFLSNDGGRICADEEGDINSMKARCVRIGDCYLKHLWSLQFLVAIIPILQTPISSSKCLSQQSQWKVASGTLGQNIQSISVYPSNLDTVYAG